MIVYINDPKNILCSLHLEIMCLLLAECVNDVYVNQIIFCVVRTDQRKNANWSGIIIVYNRACEDSSNDAFQIGRKLVRLKKMEILDVAISLHYNQS